MTGDSSNAIRDVIKEVVASQLAPARVVDLIVMESEDADGDPIFDIVVVFKAEDGRLDPDRVLGLTRHLRKPLHRLGENGRSRHRKKRMQPHDLISSARKLLGEGQVGSPKQSDLKRALSTA